MASNLGPGVSRVLDSKAREFLEVILQQGKPPMDAEFNLLQEMAQDTARKTVLSGVPSGWLGNETNVLADYQTRPEWSNWFKFGSQRAGEKQAVSWAVVNGWLVPVMGTRTGTPPGLPNDTDTTNVVALEPPPANSGDLRTDFVFLEVWQARVAPNPSATNKPNSTSLFRYGNVEGGASFLADDLVDPALGFESSQRVQLQYRIRVVKGLLGLSSYPDGFDPAVVKAKGAYDPTRPDTVTAYTFQNMRQELGDPGLWRAGDGTQNTLNTVDGYVYAIPLCGVFRRNAVTWTGNPAPNLNGGFNRNPLAVDRTGVKSFTTVPTLAAPMTATSTSITLVSAQNIPLPSNPVTPVYIQIGDEILTYQSITGNTIGNLTRGVVGVSTIAGTVADSHPAGATIKVLSGRPDGLYTDQVALTDILDLRHIVNPNGFNYDALLRYNFDKLLRGELRSNWKRSNGGTQGVFVNYQDCISQDTPALSITQLDAPDGLRTVFSDASTVQPLEAIVTPKSGAAPVNYSVGWDLDLTLNRIYPLNKGAAQWDAGDVLTAPVSQLKGGLSGANTDQVRWCNEADFQVEMRFDGDTHPISPSLFTVTSTNTDPSLFTSEDNLLITLGAGFPTVNRTLYVRLYALYGAGRGTSRIPDAVHSVSLQSPSALLLYSPEQFPADNYRMSTGFVPDWSKHANLLPAGQPGPMPVTAESYVDPGSKTLILQPFRRIAWPTSFKPMDGTAANVSSGSPVISSSAGASNGSTTFTDATQTFTTNVTVGMALVIQQGAQPGRYTVMSVTNNTNLVLDRPLLVTETGIQYEIKTAQGLMPTLKRDGVTAKWTTTDPLGLFSGSTDPQAATKNMYVSLPAHLVPKAGAFHTPILPYDTNTFSEGVNFMFVSGKGNTYGDGDRNYVPYQNGASISYALFSTLNLLPPGTNAAVYNGSFTYPGAGVFAGIRKFTDARGMGRQGLELPPFYGIARLFGVYEANDYKLNGSPYNPLNRTRVAAPTTPPATNLLRQNVKGPTFWVETDDDGDSTFILNAECLDLSRSPNTITSFATGDYVIEASIFGFDRGTFVEEVEGEREVRLVLTRYTGAQSMRQQAISQDPVTGRTSNLAATLVGPTGVLPGPLTVSDTVLYNYSRTPYGGDAWGTQTNNTDISYLSGPLSSGVAYQIAANHLDPDNLSRPNEKPFEILASLAFSTTAGTGRMAGPAFVWNPLGNAGYEDLSVYPPANSLSSRPNFYLGGTSNSPAADLYMSRYNGLTERLPLGALRRDKDFRAVFFSNTPGHTLRGNTESVGAFAGHTRSMNLEATNLLSVADSSVGVGSVVVHVDGALAGAGYPYVNFRTNRGGSGYLASGDNPGGWFAPGFVGAAQPINPVTNILSGMAFLVRNTVTYKGSAEVSAGDELMMLVATQFQHTFGVWPPPPLMVQFSTSGKGEGDAALDYYRIEGHPLVRDHVGMNVDPTQIQLARS